MLLSESRISGTTGESAACFLLCGSRGLTWVVARRRSFRDTLLDSWSARGRLGHIQEAQVHCTYKRRKCTGKGRRSLRSLGFRRRAALGMCGGGPQQSSRTTPGPQWRGSAWAVFHLPDLLVWETPRRRAATGPLEAGTESGPGATARSLGMLTVLFCFSK